MEETTRNILHLCPSLSYTDFPNRNTHLRWPATSSVEFWLSSASPEPTYCDISSIPIQYATLHIEVLLIRCIPFLLSPGLFSFVHEPINPPRFGINDNLVPVSNEGNGASNASLGYNMPNDKASTSP